MILTNKKLLIIQDFLFIIISVFYIVFRYTFFRSQETINSLYLNNLINIILGLIFILLQYFESLKNIINSINVSSGFFIVYNLIPILLQQKSMFGVFIVAEILLILINTLNLIRTNKEESVYSIKERIAYSSIIITFSIIFILRGISLIITYVQTKELTNQIAISISDCIVCSVWLILGVLFLFNKRIGRNTIYPIYIHATLLYLTLLLYMALEPIIYKKAFDLVGMITIIIMPIFFMLPMVQITSRKLAKAST